MGKQRLPWKPFIPFQTCSLFSLQTRHPPPRPHTGAGSTREPQIKEGCNCWPSFQRSLTFCLWPPSNPSYRCCPSDYLLSSSNHVTAQLKTCHGSAMPEGAGTDSLLWYLYPPSTNSCTPGLKSHQPVGSRRDQGCLFIIASLVPTTIPSLQ